MNIIIAVLVGLIPLTPALVYMLRKRRKQPKQATRRLLLGLSGLGLMRRRR